MRNAALLDQLLDPLTQCLDKQSAQRVIDLGIPQSLHRRVSELAMRANEGAITSEERTTYEALINAADFISILKFKAQRRLASNFS